MIFSVIGNEILYEYRKTDRNFIHIELIALCRFCPLLQGCLNLFVMHTYRIIVHQYDLKKKGKTQ